MKPIARMSFICAALTAAALMAYQCLPPSESGLKAVELLKMERTFSLGPVGLEGEVPASVDQFFIILDSRHSSRLFRDLYERGTAEAKMYALCGLWLTHGGFDSYAARFPHDVKKVPTISSCFRRECSPSEIVNAIRDGALDRQLKLLRK